MSLPSNPSNGDITYINGSEFVFDSAQNRWLVTRDRSEIELDSDLKRSLDSEVNVLRGFFYQGAQSAGFPVGSVVAFANGAMSQGFVLADGNTFNTTTYPELFDYLGTNVLPNYTDRTFGYKEYNWSQSFDSDSDSGPVNVVFGIAAYNGAGYNTDSEILNNVLSVMTSNYDSDIAVLQNRVTVLEEDLAQAVSDRVFTDSLLSSRLDGHDSDIALRGRFYVQPTPPSGGPNSGWVNTNNMRLHIWDETTSVWTEVALT